MYQQRRLCLLLSFLLSAFYALAQCRSDVMMTVNPTGDGDLAPAIGTTVRVCSLGATGMPCTPLEPIYTDSTLTTIQPQNPFSADSFGNIMVCAKSGTVYLETTYKGVTKVQPTYLISSSGGGGGGGNQVYPTVGIGYSTGSAWGPSFTPQNPIPASYIAPGVGSFSFTVPNAYPTIFQALAAAQTANSGPVVVFPTSTDSQPYTNSTNIRIQNYKQLPGGHDSLFFRDVSEWGKIDGMQFSCNATANSNAITCGWPTGSPVNSFVNAPISQGGDIGKLIIVDQAGAGTYGQVGGTMSVASTSGLTGGTPNSTQHIMWTDSTDGCNTIDTMPYANIALDANGLPTGNVQWTLNFYGKGCTHPPTQGTINTVGGTVTFTGGSMGQGDLVSVITAVTGPNTATLADSATYTAGGVSALYGSDVHDAFQAACNSLSRGGLLTVGTLTFSGIGLTSKGIDCNGAGFHLIGQGYQALNGFGSGSTLVYAGKTPNAGVSGTSPAAGPPAYILNVAQGGGAKIERMHFFGNSQARPYGLMTSFNPNGPGTGAFINQMGIVDQVWFGWMWGDSMAGGVRLQSCIFENGVTGNDDFWTFDHIYCYGADVGIDGVNDQATNKHFGKLSFEDNNIGFAGVGYSVVDDYYTEYQRCDITMGSPYWDGGFGTYVEFKSYGGESSAMEFCPSSHYWNGYTLQIDGGGLGGSQASFGRPDDVSGDFANNLYGSFQWYASNRGKIITPSSGCGGAGGDVVPNVFAGIFYKNIIWAPDSNCGGLSNSVSRGFLGGGFMTIQNTYPPYSTKMTVPAHNNYLGPGANSVNGQTSPFPFPPLMLDVNRSQIHIGSLQIRTVDWGVDGYGLNASTCVPLYPSNAPGPGCTPGTTTYNYQVTCTDSIGNESIAATNILASVDQGMDGTTIPTKTGPATLSATNYIGISVWQREGCPVYNLYGDEGTAGGIGYLTSLTVEQMTSFPINSPNLSFLDTGTWTKDTTRKPPTVTNSGSISVQGNLNVAGLTTLNNVNIIGACNGCGTGNGTGMVYPGPGIANVNSSNTNAWAQSYGPAPNQIPSNFIPTLNQSTTGNAATASALATAPTQCLPGNFATGIKADGTPNCSPAGNASTQVVVGVPPTNTPVIIKTPDLNTSVTFNMVSGANPSITSSTGSINFSDLIISDLAGTGTALLQADSLGNVSRSTTPAPAPIAPAGIPESTGSATGAAWMPQSYNASHQIPANYIPILNQPTTGNAATATALVGGTGGAIVQCTGGQFSTGIKATGDANCASPSGISSSLSALTAATAPNTINNLAFPQRWNFSFTGATAQSGLTIGESAASTNGASTLFQVSTLTGSTATPFSVTTGGGTGLAVNSAGNIVAQSTAIYIGPVQLPALKGQASLSTDASGNIQAGTSSNVWSSLQNPVAPLNLSMGAYTTTMTMAPNGPTNTAGLFLSDSGTTSPTNQNYLLRIQSQHQGLYPLEVLAVGGNGILVAGNTGNLSVVGTAKLVGPVQLTGTGMTSLTALGTDASGNIVPGTAGGGVGAGACATNQYVNTLTVGAAPTCSQVNYNQLTGTLTANTSGTASNVTAVSNNTLVTLSVLALPYSQLTGTVPTWNQSTTGNAATATSLASSGAASQVWGMNAAGTAQGWQTAGLGGSALCVITPITASGTYVITAAQFSPCTHFTVGAALAPTMNLPSPAPPAGQYIYVTSTSTNTFQVPATGGLLINGAAQPNYIPVAATNYPYTMRIVSDGTNWIVQKAPSGFGQLISGTAINSNYIAGNGSNITFSGTGNVNANQLLGSTVPALPASPGGYLQYTGSAFTWATPAGGGLADPGANGIIKRTALNTTAVAVAADINALGTLSNSTTGTAAGITSNGTANQVWTMLTGTTQGWQTPAGSSTATNLAGGVLGSVPYQSAPNTTTFLAPNTTTTATVLQQTGTGSAGAGPIWTSAPAISANNFTSFPSTVCTTTTCNVTNSGSSASSARITTNGTTGQYWGMTSGTVQGWVTPSAASSLPWSSLTNPTVGLTLNMGSNTTDFHFIPTGSGAVGLTLDDVGSTVTGSTILGVSATHAGTQPFYVHTQNSGGITVDTNGNLLINSLSNLQLGGIKSAATLGTDGSGNVIAGTGGAPSISSLTNATTTASISNGNNSLSWNWFLTGTLNGLTIAESTTGATGTGSLFAVVTGGGSTVSPFYAYAHSSNGLKVDATGNINAMGTAAFVGPLTGNASTSTALSTTGAANTVWGMDPTGTTQGWQTESSGIAYSVVASGVSTTTGSGTIAGVGATGCTAGVCSFTPTADGMFRFVGEVTLTTAGVGCTAGNILLQLGWVDPDNGVTYAPLAVAMSAVNFNNAIAGAMTFGVTAPSTATTFLSVPREFRAKGGNPIKFQMYQNVGESGCTQLPLFTLRAALYGPLGY